MSLKGHRTRKLHCPDGRKRKLVEQIRVPNDVASFLHPLNDEYGFSPELMGLADAICGPGGWRTGICSAMTVDVLAKVKRGKPLAMIAPARHNDWRSVR